MIPALIPQPQHHQPRPGHFHIPPRGFVGIADGRLHALALAACRLIPGHRIATSGKTDTLSMRFSNAIPAEGYRLMITPKGITILASAVPGVTYGLATLRQIIDQSPAHRLACCQIIDAPRFPLRGVYYDVTRGRVPHTDRLLEQADILAGYKINHLQHYVEHTFRFRNHPLIGRGASPLLPEDILLLDAACRARHIDLVPSLASFGHMASVLRHKPYRHLAEDCGENRYEDPQAQEHPAHHRYRAWSLAPANPDSYRFLASLFDEFVPLFSSERFNVCCDETWDLGLGQSYALCQRRGKGRVYLDHLLKLRRLAGQHGKRIMFWGDIIHRYPEQIPKIPRDITVLDWGYDHRTNFDRVAAFRNAAISFVACPGTSSWMSLFPRLHEATAAIAGYTRAAQRHGAQGILNTDWGDRGHFNFMEFSWHGYLFGAEQAWNPDANVATFTSRFARQFLGSGDGDLTRAITALGEITHLATDAHYQSIWYHIYFAAPESPLFCAPRFAGWKARGGHIRPGHFVLDARLGHRTLEQLDAIRKTLRRVSAQPNTDHHGILPYWIFAVDTLAHAAHRLTVLAPDGIRTARARRALREDMLTLQKRFTELWLARNRRSEIRTTLRAYTAAMRGL